MFISQEQLTNLERVRLLIVQNLHSHYSIEYLAGVALMSRSKLVRCYRASFGIALYAQLKYNRLQRAATLLVESDLSVKQIAKKCGYRHAGNLSTAFRNHFGVTPLMFRLLAASGELAVDQKGNSHQPGNVRHSISAGKKRRNRY